MSSNKKKKHSSDKDKKHYKDDYKGKSREESSDVHYHDHETYYHEPAGHGNHHYEEKPHDFMPYEDKTHDFKPFEDHSFEDKSKEDKSMEHVPYGYYPENKDSHKADVTQDANQFAAMEQDSDELIYIKESCNICVHTTATQASASLQIALQLAIALVLRITIFDNDKGNSIAQDLLQYFDSEQSNKQKIVIENSKDINVKTSDTDIAVNINALLEVLLSLVVKLDIA